MALEIRILVLFFVMLLVAIRPRSSEAGPITFNTALRVAKGESIFREQAIILRATRDPSPMQRDLRVQSALSVLAYGVTRDLTLFGIFPYLDMRLDATTDQGRVSRGDSGPGDAVLVTRYVLYARDRPGETQRLAPFVALKIPTGASDQQDRFGRLPQPLQLGSGSWDPIVGLIGTWQTFDWEFDSAFQYRANTPAHDFRFGNEARFDMSFQYRVWPRQLELGVPAFLYGVLESNLIVAGKNETAGIPDLNSGGTTWMLDPGIQYVTKRFILEGAVQIPVIQRLNGQALKQDYMVTAGFRVSF